MLNYCSCVMSFLSNESANGSSELVPPFEGQGESDRNAHLPPKKVAAQAVVFVSVLLVPIVIAEGLSLVFVPVSFDLVNITTLVRKRYVFLGGGVLSSWGVYARCWRYVTVRAGFGLHGAGGGGAGQEDGTDASRATRTQLHDGQPAHEAGQAEQTTRDAPAHTHTHARARAHAHHFGSTPRAPTKSNYLPAQKTFINSPRVVDV